MKWRDLNSIRQCDYYFFCKCIISIDLILFFHADMVKLVLSMVTKYLSCKDLKQAGCGTIR